MYESEANLVILTSSELPAEILERFAESRRSVEARSLIPWGEHCTECVWPTCYSTCDLYSPRPDGKCQRFVHGMVRIPCAKSLNGYLLKISFKRWAKLWSKASAELRPIPVADRAELQDLRIGSLIQAIPLRGLQNTLIHKRYSWKKRMAQRAVKATTAPNCMLIECYNPAASAMRMTLTIRSGASPIPFQLLLEMAPGFNSHRIPAERIRERIDLAQPCDIELTPNEIADGITLYFGAMDFVLDHSYHDPVVAVSAQPASLAKPHLCKCVVWDLDNTLWDGILIEDGPEKLQLKPSIREILQALDERGILISAVSKNNHEDALAALKSFGIADYFLSPQISWNPKSAGIQQVARSLNIGIDSLLFVDDSVFEREEVRSVCPEVAVLDAAEYRSILERPDCSSPVTEESRKRRLFYREQEVRDSAEKSFAGDYFIFLRDCRLRLTIRTMAEANLERVHALTQRTNQMNFSGNRYSREQLQQLLHTPGVDTYVLDCEDRFGAYGTVGFCTVNADQSCMTDLMFSCRIQAKRIEHAFLSHILRRYRAQGGGDFQVDYRKTPKNAVPGQVFSDFGFKVKSESGGVTHLVFTGDREIPDDRIAEIIDLTEKKSADVMPNLAASD